MKKREEKQQQAPVESFTILNAIKSVQAIGVAVRRELLDIPIEERAMVAKLISMALITEGTCLSKYIGRLIMESKATWTTKEQDEQIKWAIQRAFTDSPDS